MFNFAFPAIFGALALFIGGILFVFRSIFRQGPARVSLIICAVLWIAARAFNWIGIDRGLSSVFICVEELSVIFSIPLLFATVFGVLGIERLRLWIPVIIAFASAAVFAVLVLIGNPDSGFLLELRLGLPGAENPAITHSLGFFAYIFYLVAGSCTIMLVILSRLRFLPRDHARQARLFLVALALPVAGALLEISMVNSWKGIPFTSIAMSISVIIFLYGISISLQLSPIPLAHETLVDAMVDPVIVTDSASHIVYLNESAKRLLGNNKYQPGMDLSAVFPGLAGAHLEYKNNDKAMVHVGDADYVARVALVNGNLSQTQTKKASAALFVLHDVTTLTAERGQLEIEIFERTQRLEQEVARYRDAKIALERVVSEKETLLQELHHRVKNNLQIIISLINLQANRMETDTETKAVFLSMKNRVRTISLVHELMHRTRFHDGVDFGAYVHELIQGIAALFSSAPSRMALDLPDGLFVSSMDFCVDMGLVINELVTNAFKHGMGSAADGSIQVRLKSAGNEALIVIEDSGPGFPKIPGEQDRSLGMTIARSILHKHHARMEIQEGPGGHVELHIPLTPDGLSHA